MNRRPARSTAAVIAAPALLSLLAIAGLVIGLTGSGWRDVLCIAALALPLIVFLFHVLRRNDPVRRSKTKVLP